MKLKIWETEHDEESERLRDRDSNHWSCDLGEQERERVSECRESESG